MLSGHVNVADEDGMIKCFLLEATGPTTTGGIATVRIAIAETNLKAFITMVTENAHETFPIAMAEPDPSS